MIDQKEGSISELSALAERAIATSGKARGLEICIERAAVPAVDPASETPDEWGEKSATWGTWVTWYTWQSQG